MTTYASIRAEIARLRREKIAAFQREYPVGSVVTYQHARTIRTVEIIDHSDYADRCKVRGVESGREYWLEGSRIIGADEEEE